MGTRVDLITLRGVSAVGHHGVLDFERRDGQTFVVDAILHSDFARAAASDDLAHTASYAEIAERITEIIEGDPVNLIETLAVRIAEMVLGEFAAIDAAEITVHKPKAPIEVPFDDVAVTVFRGRQA
ncbi:dihydroneopterin aldolase [Sinomonas sp. JGH33]|uniref:7,8-dihydroneopterin aldolase n=1 Tax=Sinomonas terricola TaxID=3110330 RepID=A0ABU5T5J5_9MICC|nr:dihydroneopterin aldolase [Sinomonas sp. JGH33]MEA5454784.1 dihydroneopterin aldolase [Sinomonas sp. JGH33]